MSDINNPSTRLEFRKRTPGGGSAQLMDGLAFAHRKRRPIFKPFHCPESRGKEGEFPATPPDC